MSDMMGGGYKITPTIKGKLTPIRDNVIVEDMYFGEEKTKGGIIITNDDGTDRGIKPRWAKIYAIGSTNTEEYSVGDWVLVEHGRWTRGINLTDDEGNQKTLRMVDKDCIMLWSDEEPTRDATFGIETDLSAASHRPEDFVTNG